MLGQSIFFKVSEAKMAEYGGRDFIVELVSDTGATIVDDESVADILVVNKMKSDSTKKQYLLSDFMEEFINKLMFGDE